jgi:putative ABC transport system permease protein
MGFNQEQILMVDVGPNFFNQYGGFKSELQKNADVQSVTLLGGSIPGAVEIIENAFVATGMPEEQQQWFSVLFASHDFEKTLDLEFIQGHGFQPGSSSDSVGYIINESAARALGWGEDVVGRSIDRLGNGNVLQSGAVIGLVKDFNYRPLYDPIKPLVISLGGNTLAIKIQSEDLDETLSTIEGFWTSQFEDVPFRYSFMDDNFDLLYRKEDKFGKTIEYFSVLAIFIACLGLLGLSSFTTESRRKEIAIRKVNGASTLGLVGLLTRDFSILIMIAFIIAVPASYYLSTLWLSNFAYQAEIGVSIFLLAGIIALILAVVTVSYHTIKAAITNPVNSLRYE